jgi:hypothetical protein
MSDQESRGFDIALQTVGEFRNEDLREKAANSEDLPAPRGWWNGVLNRNINAALKLPPAQQADALARLKKRLHDGVQAPRLQELKEGFLKQIERDEEKGKAITRVQELVGNFNFNGARRVIRDLPRTDDFAEFKNNLLKQIDQAEGQYQEVLVENATLRKSLGYRGYNAFQIDQNVKGNNIDSSNPFDMNRLLKFMQNH